MSDYDPEEDAQIEKFHDTLGEIFVPEDGGYDDPEDDPEAICPECDAPATHALICSRARKGL